MANDQNSAGWNKQAVLRTVVDLTFLALALVLMTILLAGRFDTTAQQATALEIQNLRQDVLQVGMENVLYLESKVNRVAETSDKYQTSTSGRLQVLEQRMKVLESRRQNSGSRIINTNTAISNGLPEKKPAIRTTE